MKKTDCIHYDWQVYWANGKFLSYVGAPCFWESTSLLSSSWPRILHLAQAQDIKLVAIFPLQPSCAGILRVSATAPGWHTDFKEGVRGTTTLWEIIWQCSLKLNIFLAHTFFFFFTPLRPRRNQAQAAVHKNVHSCLVADIWHKGMTIVKQMNPGVFICRNTPNTKEQMYDSKHAGLRLERSSQAYSRRGIGRFIRAKVSIMKICLLVN